MPHAIAIAVLIGVSFLLVTPARADRLGKGRSLVTVGIGGHRGQFVSVLPGFLSFPGAVFRIESGEVGGEIGYHRFLSDQWTVGISAGYHVSRMVAESSDLTETDRTHSFTVRIGGDRYAFIDDNVAVYAGPGIFFTRGRWKSEAVDFTIEGPDATEIGFNGRIGMYARLGKGWALTGHIGQVLSRTSGEDPVGKTNWWSSTSEGSAGLAMDF